MKMHSAFALLLLLAATTNPLCAQAPTPGPEHQRLAGKAGTWNTVIEATGADGKVSQSKGVSKVTVACGGLWIIDDFHADFGGGPFHGHGLTGYDPKKGKYVGAWVDSLTPMLMTIEGSYDKDGKVLTMTGMAPGMDGGKPVLHRFVTTHKDANTDVFEMFVPGPDGKEVKLMTITYTRVVEKAPAK